MVTSPYHYIRFISKQINIFFLLKNYIAPIRNQTTVHIFVWYYIHIPVQEEKTRVRLRTRSLSV